MDKQKIKQQISDIFNSSVKSLFDITDKLEERICGLESVISEKTEALLKISTEYDNISKQISQEKREFTQTREVTRKESEQLKTLQFNVEKNYKKLENENNILSSRLLNLKEEISRLMKEKESIQVFEGIKLNLIKDIDKYKTEILDIKKQIETTKKEKGKTIFDLDNEITNKRKEQEKLLEKVIPSFEGVKERTKELDIRERDLKVVENRYRKLYTEKGASFKV